jgi:large subunit ribosomal protein L17
MLGSTQTHTPGENRVRNAIEKLCKDLAPRFKDRQGGYTQIFRLASRRAGDNAEQCIMRYLPGPEDKKAKAPKDKAEGKKATKEAKKASETVAEDKPVTKKAEKASKPTADKKTKAANKD